MIATACGYRWSEIDEMTLPQYRELAAYWEKFPPMHLMLAKLVGPKSSDRKTNDLGELLAGFGTGGSFGTR